jgi:hypothetical protein
MSTAIHFDVERPASYQPSQLLVRLLIMFALAVVGAPLGWIFHVLYLALPLLAAVTIGTLGAARYHEEVGASLVRALRWYLGLHAYLALLTDRLPLDEQLIGVRYEVAPHGAPSLASALMKLVTSIPALIVMWVLGVVAAVLWVIAALGILVTGGYSAWIFDFQRGVLRMFARFLAHHASLVEGAAPIAFDTGPDPIAVVATPVTAP